MGGSINIAARFNDGETICVDGWTNFMPTMIINDTTLSGDDSVVRKTLMEVANHKAYSGPQPFKASGYGMVVIDFIAQKIHSMQGYTSFNTKMLIQLLDINATGWQGSDYIQILSEESAGLLNAERVYIATRNGEEIERYLLTRDEAMKMLDNDFKQTFKPDGKDYFGLEINTAPFEIIEYPEGSSLTKMKEILKADGFPIKKSDGLNRIFTKT